MALSYQVTKEWVVITYNYHFCVSTLKDCSPFPSLFPSSSPLTPPPPSVAYCR